jgi:RsiW-degrading membrane proteinase PrsW (M82 family)/rRNA maturation protein Nop10
LRGSDLDFLYAILGLAPGLAPGLLWLCYFYFRSSRQPKSFANIIRVFIWGCASCVPALTIELLTGAELTQDDLWRSAASSFLIIAPNEEFFKLVAVWIAIYRSPEFREPIDGIVYSSTAALAFASVENIVYLGHMGPGIIVSRTVYATPAHVMFASMWGYSMGLARFRREDELLVIAQGFLIAVGLHGLYDFLVALHPRTAMFSLIPLMILMAWLMNRRIREFLRTYPFPPIGEGAVIACPNCGAYTLEAMESCSRCGSAIPLLEIDAPRFCGRCRALLNPCRDVCPRCGSQVFLSRLCPPGSR